MPYIPDEEREEWEQTVIPQIKTPGQLNYMISDLIDTYLWGKNLNYTALNDAIGVLECAKMELYRRVAAPYEDKKCEENGDVYTCLEEDND